MRLAGTKPPANSMLYPSDIFLGVGGRKENPIINQELKDVVVVVDCGTQA